MARLGLALYFHSTHCALKSEPNSQFCVLQKMQASYNLYYAYLPTVYISKNNSKHKIL